MPLTLHGIVKRFGRVVALDGADLSVNAGTVHALLGENGAGKTTLMRIAFGMLRPDAGTVALGPNALRPRSPADAIAAGVGMVQQHFALVPVMTVADNVALGGRGRYDARAAADRVRAIAADTGLTVDPHAIIADLSVEAQQRVEIVKALAHEARLLILDEPTAVLSPPAVAELLRWLRRFADGGGAAVLITHKLREAVAVADDVTVLRRGRTVLAARAAGLDEDELAAAMLGDARDSGFGIRGSQLQQRNEPVAAQFSRPSNVVALTNAESRTPNPDPVPVFIAEHITLRDARGITKIADASFAVHGGEIVGVAAAEGEGQHELLRALAGRWPIVGGTLTLPPAIGFVPEDRQRDALVLDFALYENVALRGAGSRRGRMAWSDVRAQTKGLLVAFDILAPSVRIAAAALSGGNQQKLVFARELGAGPRALVAENPTRGLDVQATAAVHGRLRAARDRGTAIVLYASDLDEVLALADRVLVVSGRSVREVPLDRSAVGQAMVGLVRSSPSS